MYVIWEDILNIKLKKNKSMEENLEIKDITINIKNDSMKIPCDDTGSKRKGVLKINCGLYKIVNKLNNHFYIGSSDDIIRRWRDGHRGKLRKNKHENPHLQNSWNKYGENNFELIPYKECDVKSLLLAEQKDLDIWVGRPECYNIRESATCPTAPGSKRPDWVVKKYADAQRGKPRWTEEQKKQMSIDRKGRKFSPETIEKLKLRRHTDETKKKISEASKNQKWTLQWCKNISNSKLLKQRKFTDEERKKISDGVQKSIQEGRYHKNKISLNEYENIKSLYLSGNMNQKNLSIKYGVTPPSMYRLLKKLGVK